MITHTHKQIILHNHRIFLLVPSEFENFFVTFFYFDKMATLKLNPSITHVNVTLFTNILSRYLPF